MLLNPTCPACRKGPLYQTWLKLAPSCIQCGQSFHKEDVGDGPAFAVIVVVGFLATLLAVFVELAYQPPLWLHALLWVPFTLGASLLLLRVFKTALIYWQYRSGRLE
jgi:uncharacterized protein (DUF983 family)